MNTDFLIPMPCSHQHCVFGPWLTFIQNLHLHNRKACYRCTSTDESLPTTDMPSSYSFRLLALLTVFLGIIRTTRSFQSSSQYAIGRPRSGHNELYLPSPDRPVPIKIPFEIDETVHYHLKHINGSENGYYRRSSCPAVNTLANRGYINRSGRNIAYEEIAQASRDVYNFGDDNVCGSRVQRSRFLGRTLKFIDHIGPRAHLRSPFPP